MGLKQSSKRTDQVAEYFEALIREHIYHPGDKLPSLDEIAGILQVSKSTIREGLVSLVAQGLIEVRHGRGYYVQAAAERAERAGAPQDLGQVLFVRLLLEVPAAKLAARNRTEANLYVMIKQLQIMREGSRSQAIAADLDFHMEVARASGNAILAGQVASLTENMRETMKYSRTIAGDPVELFTKHKELLDAIRDRESDSAERLMFQHLNDTAERLRILVPESWAIDGTRHGDE